MSGIVMKNQTTFSAISSALSGESDDVIRVFGHLNPDSDSICSALVVADWLNATKRAARPYRLGDLTPETRYILNAAGAPQPALLTEPLTDKKVWLVDFTDVEQGPSTLAQSDVVGIIDHHRIGTLITKNPPDCWIRAVGCCATIVLSLLMADSRVVLSTAQATLLLGAILSDTVVLTSPTTTPQDRQAVATLRDSIGQDYDTFVSGLLRAKTSLQGQSAAQLLHRDAKQYRIHGVSLLLSQLELRDMADVAPCLPALLQEAEQTRQATGLDMVVLMLTDITHRNSTLYFSENHFIETSKISLLGMTSRKKDILPWLTDCLAVQPG